MVASEAKRSKEQWEFDIMCGLFCFCFCFAWVFFVLGKGARV